MLEKKAVATLVAVVESDRIDEHATCCFQCVCVCVFTIHAGNIRAGRTVSCEDCTLIRLYRTWILCVW